MMGNGPRADFFDPGSEPFIGIVSLTGGGTDTLIQRSADIGPIPVGDSRTVDVEIVAFGPGLRLLFEENANAGRIDGLAQSGVRFFACQNTINNMSNTLGRPVKINTHASSGKGGIVRIKELVDQGYMLAKP